MRQNTSLGVNNDDNIMFSIIGIMLIVMLFHTKKIQKLSNKILTNTFSNMY